MTKASRIMKNLDDARTVVGQLTKESFIDLVDESNSYQATFELHPEGGLKIPRSDRNQVLDRHRALELGRWLVAMFGEEDYE